MAKHFVLNHHHSTTTQVLIFCNNDRAGERQSPLPSKSFRVQITAGSKVDLTQCNKKEELQYFYEIDIA